MTILLMGGGAGFGSIADIAERLLRAGGDLKIIAIAGRDKSALTALTDLAASYPGRLAPLAQTDKIERLMACSDMVIT